MSAYANLDTLSTTKPLQFDLYYNRNHEATLYSGEVKSYAVKERGSAIYDNRKSGYTVSVERLLWVDGYEGSPVGDESKTSDREMTLVVLKIVLASHNPHIKFSFVKASLGFEDKDYKLDQGLSEPRVEAWAPFHSVERWNPLISHQKKSNKLDAGVKLGYSGADLSGGWGSEGEAAWDRTVFDQGRSNAEISPITGSRNGVTWVLEQNDLENAGVSQEFWAAVLLSRNTPDPYLVQFRIDTRVGTLEDFKNKTKNFFGLHPSRTKPFQVTPGKNTVCNFEGNDIIKGVDLKNLGRLRSPENRSRLDVKWGPDYKVEIPTPSHRTSEASDEARPEEGVQEQVSAGYADGLDGRSSDDAT
ncbi:hypothetical protein TARUN_3637 [Trichoderma arundinaceum]|uniref:Uncharacterized protein n=1 Tax=Trichoderma arundinaceum TaxID=490622 RepID=A0A395NRM5_TRIAR|nr:hypothetical protein TARUN_3637 [Trichoderma arundinaceum]